VRVVKHRKDGNNAAIAQRSYRRNHCTIVDMIQMNNAVVYGVHACVVGLEHAECLGEA
jgi:hypothetical protein